MSTRISTNMVYNASLHTMLGKQASMNKLQTQLATGQKLVSAKAPLPHWASTPPTPTACTTVWACRKTRWPRLVN